MKKAAAFALIMLVCMAGTALALESSDASDSSEWQWVQVKNLRVSDKLMDSSGNEVEITSIEHVELAEPITVYDLEVEKYHYYFANGVLVHNSGGDSATTTFVSGGNSYNYATLEGISAFATAYQGMTLKDDGTIAYGTNTGDIVSVHLGENTKIQKIVGTDNWYAVSDDNGATWKQFINDGDEYFIVEPSTGEVSEVHMDGKDYTLTTPNKKSQAVVTMFQDQASKKIIIEMGVLSEKITSPTEQAEETENWNGKTLTKNGIYWEDSDKKKYQIVSTPNEDVYVEFDADNNPVRVMNAAGEEIQGFSLPATQGPTGTGSQSSTQTPNIIYEGPKQLVYGADNQLVYNQLVVTELNGKVSAKNGAQNVRLPTDNPLAYEGVDWSKWDGKASTFTLNDGATREIKQEESLVLGFIHFPTGTLSLVDTRREADTSISETYILKPGENKVLSGATLTKQHITLNLDGALYTQIKDRIDLANSDLAHNIISLGKDERAILSNDGNTLEFKRLTSQGWISTKREEALNNGARRVTDFNNQGAAIRITETSNTYRITETRNSNGETSSVELIAMYNGAPVGESVKVDNPSQIITSNDGSKSVVYQRGSQTIYHTIRVDGAVIRSVVDKDGSFVESTTIQNGQLTSRSTTIDGSQVTATITGTGNNRKVTITYGGTAYTQGDIRGQYHATINNAVHNYDSDGYEIGDNGQRIPNQNREEAAARKKVFNELENADAEADLVERQVNRESDVHGKNAQEIRRLDTIIRRQRIASTINEVMNPGQGVGLLTHWLDKDIGINATTLRAQFMDSPLAALFPDYEKALCEQLYKDERTYFVQDFPTHYEIGGGLPDLGLVMFTTGTRTESARPFEDTTCRINGEMPRWIATVDEQGNAQALGYLYKISWHVMRAPKETTFRVHLFGSGECNELAELKTDTFSVESDRTGTISAYKKGFYDRVCIIFDSFAWSLDGDRQYPKNCARMPDGNGEIRLVATAFGTLTISPTGGTEATQNGQPVNPDNMANDVTFP